MKITQFLLFVVDNNKNDRQKRRRNFYYGNQIIIIIIIIDDLIEYGSRTIIIFVNQSWKYDSLMLEVKKMKNTISDVLWAIYHQTFFLDYYNIWLMIIWWTLFGLLVCVCDWWQFYFIFIPCDCIVCGWGLSS